MRQRSAAAPEHIVEATRARYINAYERISELNSTTGSALA